MESAYGFLQSKAAEAYEKVMGHAPELPEYESEIVPPAPVDSALAVFEARKAEARKRYDDAVYPALGAYELAKLKAAEAYFRDIGERI
jgi:hypothetical protein